MTEKQTIILNSEKPSGSFAPQARIAAHTHKHSDLTCLENDDHPQYLNVERGKQLFDSLALSLGSDSDGDVTTIAIKGNGIPLTIDASCLNFIGAGLTLDVNDPNQVNINVQHDGRNVGDGEEIYRDVSARTLSFRTIRGAGTVTVTTVGDEIIITGTGIPALPFDITSFTGTPILSDISPDAVDAVNGNLLEVGATLETVNFIATTNATPDDAFLTDPNLVLADITTLGATLGTTMMFTWNGSVSSSTLNDVSVFNLNASLGSENDNDTVAFTWAAKTYWGADLPTGYSVGQSPPISNAGLDTLITGLGDSQLDNNRQTTFTTTAAAGEKVYYAYPAAYGEALPTDFKEVTFGFVGGFFRVETSAPIFVTNQFGEVIEYYLYESDQLSLGLISIEVS